LLYASIAALPAATAASALLAAPCCTLYALRAARCAMLRCSRSMLAISITEENIENVSAKSIEEMVAASERNQSA